MSEGFKQCGCCAKMWGSLTEFLSDPQVYYLGVMAGPQDSLFLFHHNACGTSVAISLDTLDLHFLQFNEGRTQEAP